MKLLPKGHVLSENDVVLPLAPFSDTISRTVTFAALASGIYHYIEMSNIRIDTAPSSFH
jgi:hypothetical protein